MSRRILSAGLLAAAALVLVLEATVRQAETAATAFLAGTVFGLDTFTSSLQPVLYVTTATDPAPSWGDVWVGLMVTRECTVAWLLAPLLLLSAVMARGRRLTVGAVAIAAAVAAAALVAVNLLRLLIIVLATHRWGMGTGYRWSHDVYGSLVGVLGVGLALVLFLITATRLSHRGGIGAAARTQA
ncbi:MAG: archaeosortase/exosortase family protein [Acidimicrobiia bacterium]